MRYCGCDKNSTDPFSFSRKELTSTIKRTKERRGEEDANEAKERWRRVNTSEPSISNGADGNFLFTNLGVKPFASRPLLMYSFIVSSKLGWMISKIKWVKPTNLENQRAENQQVNKPTGQDKRAKRPTNQQTYEPTNNLLPYLENINTSEFVQLALLLFVCSSRFWVKHLLPLFG